MVGDDDLAGRGQAADARSAIGPGNGDRELPRLDEDDKESQAQSAPLLQEEQPEDRLLKEVENEALAAQKKYLEELERIARIADQKRLAKLR